MKNYKILFVSHDASRTGAPIVLLNFLNWLKRNSSIEFDILIINRGELEIDFEKIGNTYIWNRVFPMFILKRILLNIIKNFFFNKNFTFNQNMILSKLKKKKIDLIYYNTVASHDLMPIFKNEINTPIISHIHEMPFSIKAYFPSLMNIEYTQNVSKFICVASIVKKGLIENWNIPVEKIELIYPFIEFQNVKNEVENVSKNKIKLKFGDKFVVGGSGALGWRKGLDLFINLSREVYKLNPNLPILFVWVGGVNNEVTEGYKYENDLLKISNNLIFTGHVKNSKDYYSVFDLFVLTSREDPFPLTCVEVASLEKPIICFENTSGISEFIKSKYNTIIPYGDVKAMAEKVIELHNDDVQMSYLGKKNGINALEYDINLIAPKIERLICEMIENHN